MRGDLGFGGAMYGTLEWKRMFVNCILHSWIGKLAICKSNFLPEQDNHYLI